ncbi:MAG: anthranilate synthase component I family protein [Saprospiraceae bacterium]|nr:anthranilate synthase component I family protein [Saprospiraceae bacterium]
MKINISNFDINLLKKKALGWANVQSEVLCYLDSNDYNQDKLSKYSCLIAVGVQEELIVKAAGSAFEQLKRFAANNDKWLFGHFNYDLKYETEQLQSKNEDFICFPELYFFVPSYLCLFHENKYLEILSSSKPPNQIWESIQAHNVSSNQNNTPIIVQNKISRKGYLSTIQKIREHIIEGNVYEMNFCQEFYAKNILLDPIALFNKLNNIARAPFSAYYKLNKKYLLCGSPERFLCKRGNKIISQPIKGTIRRGENLDEDEQLKLKLYNSVKDRSENVMIVDLVRNDLTKSCQIGTIQVKELFGVYEFEKVFQMISTITGELLEEIHWVDVIRSAFPMGSMTGAPKRMSMELIESYEKTKRGLYSGTLGYVSPDGDFDFNVVIRSLLYNEQDQYLSFQVGGAIVYDSNPMDEFQECLLKVEAIREALEG